MIRIRSIELSNVKNVANGTIGFKDSPFGSVKEILKEKRKIKRKKTKHKYLILF